MEGMSIRRAEVIAKGTLIVYISIDFYIILYGGGCAKTFLPCGVF